MTDSPAWREEAIAKHHKRNQFDCGNHELTEYLSKYARQNHERGGAKTWLAVSEADQSVLGYYSLSFTSILRELVPESHRPRGGNYDVPLFVLVRLAVDRSVQGMGLGGALLLAAGERCMHLAEQIGGYGLFIEAKNDHVSRWYQRFGAIPLDDSSFKLVLLFSSIARASDMDGKI